MSLTGKKDALGDVEKPRLSLIPRMALWALGKALTYGEKHYGTHNWRNGIAISALLDAALRHIFQYLDGEDIDEKSQNHHLGNAMANLAMAIELHYTTPEADDRFKRNQSKIETADLTEEEIAMLDEEDTLVCLASDGELIHTAGGLVYKDEKIIMPVEKAIKEGLVKKVTSGTENKEAISNC